MRPGWPGSCPCAQEEQDGLTGWLEDVGRPSGQVVFRLLREGQVLDAVPFGLAVAEL